MVTIIGIYFMSKCYHEETCGGLRYKIYFQMCGLHLRYTHNIATFWATRKCVVALGKLDTI